MTACLLLPVLAGSAFKCAVSMDPMRANSADGKTTVVVMRREEKILIYGKGQKEPKYTAKWLRFGHHESLMVSADGSSIAVVDEYAGFEILDGTGKRRILLLPEQILTTDELANTPGKWTCHTEGKWSLAPQLRFASNSVSVSTHSGRKATFQFGN